MDVWGPVVSRFYDIAAHNGTVYGWVVYAYAAERQPGEGDQKLSFGIAEGRLSSFVDFEADREESRLTLGLRGSLDMPVPSDAGWFDPMELEIKLDPTTGETLTTLSGAPGRRAGGDVTFTDGDPLAGYGNYWQPMPGGYVSVN